MTKARLLTPLLLLALLAVAHAETDAAAPSTVKLRELELPTEKSAMPKRGEWSEARPVAFERPSARCTAHVVREWLRIQCGKLIAEGITLLSGDRKDVYFWISEQKFSEKDQLATAWWEGSLDSSKWSAEIVLPLRRGDRRVMQITFNEAGSGYGGESHALIVSELWLEGESAPIVTID